MNNNEHMSNEPSDLLKLIGSEEEAAALSSLCVLAKSKALRESILDSADFDAIHKALLDGSPKARKNAARLLGALKRKEDEDVLIQALMSEQKRFVRPSIILALGVIGGEKAKQALISLDTPIAADLTEQKHAREEAEAIRQALLRLTPSQKHEFTGLTKPAFIKLICHEGFAPILDEELKELGFGETKLRNTSVSLLTKEYETVFKARSFKEARISIGTRLPIEPVELCARIKKPVIDFISSCHSGNPPYTYRIECKDIKNRAVFTQSMAKELDTGFLLNNPSSYEFEIIVEGHSLAFVYCKLHSFEDNRFSYRKNALPASIAPSAAAAIARMVRRDGPVSVLDPFCGSGTLLIEYGKLNPQATLLGIDINSHALRLAKENAQAASLNPSFLLRDCTGFKCKKPFDIVLANLPFGLRVGNHKNNELLYGRLIDALPSWMNDDGRALLYTMEYTLLKRLIKQSPSLIIDSEIRTEQGGLMPYVISVLKS